MSLILLVFLLLSQYFQILVLEFHSTQIDSLELPVSQELILKVQEVRVRLEVRVLLSDHVDAWEHTGEHAFCSSDTSYVTLCKATCSCLASDSELLENSSFMLGVALDDADHVGDHVIALIEKNIDVVPCILGVFIQINEAVPG